MEWDRGWVGRGEGRGTPRPASIPASSVFPVRFTKRGTPGGFSAEDAEAQASQTPRQPALQPAVSPAWSTPSVDKTHSGARKARVAVGLPKRRLRHASSNTTSIWRASEQQTTLEANEQQFGTYQAAIPPRGTPVEAP